MPEPAERARLEWAVCPRIEQSGSPHIPKMFKTKAAADKFRNSEIQLSSERKAQLRKDRKEAKEKVRCGELHPSAYPFHLKPIRNKGQGWENPVPVCRSTDDAGLECKRMLTDFLPADRVGAMPAFNFANEVDRIFEGRSADYTCCLDHDWRFDEIEADAWKRGGHEYDGKPYERIGEIVVGAVHDLEAALHRFHPNAGCIAVANFWRSWQVQRHLATFCLKLRESATAAALAGSYGAAVAEAESARIFSNRQLAVFAHSLGDVIPTPGAGVDAYNPGSKTPRRALVPLPASALDGRAESLTKAEDHEVRAAPPRAAQFPAEPDNGTAEWEAIEISFLSDERVQIRNGKDNDTRNYQEWGFADRRTKKPNLAWITLRNLAEARGVIQASTKPGGSWVKVEKRMQEIRKALRKHFRILADPVPFVKGTGYKTSFKIGCSPAFHT